MKYKYWVFDLDGTISDPKDGIVRSLNHALSAHGFACQDESALATYIGPPLDSTFKIITDSDDPALITSLVAKYRERYSEVGYSENVLYAGIPEVLEQLSSIPGIRLGICTSKRVDFAERILELFGLQHFFAFVDGGDVGIEKWQQLQALIEKTVINQNSLMIGDRDVDLAAAHRNQIHAAGVLWGYGSLDEIEEHKPAYIFSNPGDIAALAANNI
jgi:phosphoglycolate phosphatase